MNIGIMFTPCDAVGGAGGDERRHRAGLGDAFFENLAVLRFAVVRATGRNRPARRAGRRGNRCRSGGTGFHAERARLVGHDRHDVLADLLVAQQRAQQPHEAHRGRHLAVAALLSMKPAIFVERRHFERPPAPIGRPGTEPPSASRRSRRYFISGLSSGGRRTGPWPRRRRRSECRSGCGTRAARLR